MILEMFDVADKCIEEVQTTNEEMVMTKEDLIDFKNAKCCHICNKEFEKPGGKKLFCKSFKVRDHDHQTGKFRGAAHSHCNINYFTNRYVPVVFHNLKGYDSHLIMKHAYTIQ